MEAAGNPTVLLPIHRVVVQEDHTAHPPGLHLHLHLQEAGEAAPAALHPAQVAEEDKQTG